MPEEPKEIRPRRLKSTPQADAVPGPAETGKDPDELERLRGELAARIAVLETEKKSIEEIGGELAGRSEELEKRDAELTVRLHEIARKDAELKKRDGEISKKADLVATSSDALTALGEELREKERKIKKTDEDVGRSRKEIEASRKEIANREEKLLSQIREIEEQRKNVERLLSDLQRKENALMEHEVEFSRREEDTLRLRKTLDDTETRLKNWTEKIKKRDEELRSLEQHLLSLETEMELCPHCGVSDQFTRISGRVEKLRKGGENTEDISLELRAARKAQHAGSYENAAEHARKAAALVRDREMETRRREVLTRILASENLVRMLREARAEVTQTEALVKTAWAAFKMEDLTAAQQAAEQAHIQALTIEHDRFRALDELIASNSVITSMKRSGVGVADAEKKRQDAEAAMSSGDFKRAAQLAAEAVQLAGDAAQAQDVGASISQIKLAEETLDELRSLGLDVEESERGLGRARDLLKKLDFKGADENARYVRQKAKEASRSYKQTLLAIDNTSSIVSAYKDLGLHLKRAEELLDESKAKLKQGDPDLAINLARKGEHVARDTAERQKQATSALRKANIATREDRKLGKDVTKSEKLYDLAIHQLELGEYANAMKLASKASEACTSSGGPEICQTCGEAIPENMKECPVCAEKKNRKEKEAIRKKEIVQKTKLGAKGGRKYACPYCGELFEISVTERPLTVPCPWCGNDVSVVD